MPSDPSQLGFSPRASGDSSRGASFLAAPDDLHRTVYLLAIITALPHVIVVVAAAKSTANKAVVDVNVSLGGHRLIRRIKQRFIRLLRTHPTVHSISSDVSGTILGSIKGVIQIRQLVHRLDHLAAPLERHIPRRPSFGRLGSPVHPVLPGHIENFFRSVVTVWRLRPTQSEEVQRGLGHASNCRPLPHSRFDIRTAELRPPNATPGRS